MKKEQEESLRAEMLAYAAKQYGTVLEYLWKRLPHHAVLRQADNSKWYGLVMPVNRKKLELPYAGKVDVLNVKGNRIEIENPVEKWLVAYGPQTGKVHIYHKNNHQMPPQGKAQGEEGTGLPCAVAD